jgi:hypothetical protein
VTFSKRPVMRQGLILLLIVIGFAIRVYALNDVAINPDEQRIISQIFAKSFGNVLSVTTLHGFPEHTFANILIWFSRKLGWQPFLLRWPAVLFGVLTLTLIYKITKKVLDSTYAMASAFLLAFSAYHLLYSQQIRGYSEMVFFALASFYYLWRAMKTYCWQDWISYTLSTALAMYSHFYAFTLLATQGIMVAIWLILRVVQQRPSLGPFLRHQVIPPLASGVGSAIMAVLLLAPILLPRFFQGFAAASSDFPVSTVSLVDSILPYLDLFSQYSGTGPIWSVTLFSVLILTGAFYLLRIKPVLASILLGWLIIPFLIVVMAQRYIGWFYVRDRYLIYILPVFIILAATGWVSLTKAAKGIRPIIGTIFFSFSLVIIIIILSFSLSNRIRTATEGNWQDVSDFLVENALPIDMFICEPFVHGWKDVDLDPTDKCTRSISYGISRQTEIIYPIYNLYAAARYNTFVENRVLLERNPSIWIIIWNLPEAPDYRGITPQASFHRFGHTIILGPVAGDNVIASFIQSLEQVSRLADDPSTQFALLVRLADLQAALGRTGAATQTLAQVKQIMPDDEEARKQVAMVEQHLDQPPLLTGPDHNLSVDLGQQILLKGYSLAPEPPAPGQPMQLTLFWQALAPMDVDYSAFLHLRNEANQTVAQIDFFPNRPTSSWWVGDVLQSTRQFEVPAELPAGKYRLLVGLYNSETLERLPAQNDSTGENAIELTKFEIQ